MGDDGERATRVAVDHRVDELVERHDVERTLSEDDLVICDSTGPISLAGTMGAGDSSVNLDERVSGWWLQNQKVEEPLVLEMPGGNFSVRPVSPE